ncbi:MAG: hypothetical protein U0694_18830 [Anaerolineae bacterium]
MAQNSFVLPDYHFMLVAPNLGAEWLFAGARLYWQTFRPTVISDFELLTLIPLRYSLAVTCIARRDIVDYYREQLTQVAPRALFDPVVYDYVEDLQLTLDGRAQLYQPFGVPVPPTATPTMTLFPSVTPGPPPTEGPPATRPPAGYITQTPPPTTTTGG